MWNGRGAYFDSKSSRLHYLLSNLSLYITIHVMKIVEQDNECTTYYLINNLA
jgi:hypothetical protein